MGFISYTFFVLYMLDQAVGKGRETGGEKRGRNVGIYRCLPLLHYPSPIREKGKKGGGEEIRKEKGKDEGWAIGSLAFPSPRVRLRRGK